MEITHPFHPLKGERFRILKRWRHAGRPFLILDGTPTGTYTILEAWTSAHPDALVGGDCLGAEAVLELRELLADLLSRGRSGRCVGVDGGGEAC